MNKSLLYIWLVLNVFLIIGCNDYPEVTKYYYRNSIDSIAINLKQSDSNEIPVDFKILFDSLSWDSVIIAGPYMTNKQQKIFEFCNYKSVEDEIYKIKNADWKFGLFFIKNGCYQGYTILSSDPTFSRMFNEGNIPIIKISNSVVYLKKLKNIRSNNEGLYFDFKVIQSVP